MVDPPLQALGEQEQVRADIRRHVYGQWMASGQDTCYQWEPRPQLRGVPVQRQDWDGEAHPIQTERAEKLAKMGILGRTTNKRKGPLEQPEPAQPTTRTNYYLPPVYREFFSQEPEGSIEGESE